LTDCRSIASRVTLGDERVSLSMRWNPRHDTRPPTYAPRGGDFGKRAKAARTTACDGGAEAGDSDRSVRARCGRVYIPTWDPTNELRRNMVAAARGRRVIVDVRHAAGAGPLMCEPDRGRPWQGVRAWLSLPQCQPQPGHSVPVNASPPGPPRNPRRRGRATGHLGRTLRCSRRLWAGRTAYRW
jgi:hypothetical protein